MKFFITLLLSIACTYASSLGLNLGSPSPARGLIGLDYSPQDSRFEYSVFYGNLDLINYDAGVSISYLLNEERSFYILQGYHWMFGGSSETPHTLGIYSGLGYRLLLNEDFSIYSEAAIPVFINENGTYSKFTGTRYKRGEAGFLLGVGLSYRLF